MSHLQDRDRVARQPNAAILLRALQTHRPRPLGLRTVPHSRPKSVDQLHRQQTGIRSHRTHGVGRFARNSSFPDRRIIARLVSQLSLLYRGKLGPAMNPYVRSNPRLLPLGGRFIAPGSASHQATRVWRSCSMDGNERGASPLRRSQILPNRTRQCIGFDTERSDASSAHLREGCRKTQQLKPLRLKDWATR